MSAHETLMTLFGTDGIRDRAGAGLLARASVGMIGRAIAAALEESDLDGRRLVLVGRDTRSSGAEIFESLAIELTARGFDVADLGVLPTPGVAFSATREPSACLAIVLSASHNPAEYNGIKLLSREGTKASDDFETSVTAHYTRELEGERAPSLAPRRRGARLSRAERAREHYVQFLVQSCRRPERIAGKRFVLDAAHGAAFDVAPETFRRLGAHVELIGAAPDGSNINAGCGALAPGDLAAKVRDTRAVCGFAFDGDADRMIPVTGAGEILDGDFVLALAGRAYSREGRLPLGTVVGTVMSNVGLERALDELGLSLLRAQVGDRHVWRALLDGDHPIGGEQSGHLIFRDHAATGDGVLAALRLLDVLESDELLLHEEARLMTRFPQILRNVRVRERIPLLAIESVAEAVAAAEARLGRDGRVLLRYSGTEPLARVMLEGAQQDLIDGLCGEICATIEAAIGVD